MRRMIVVDYTPKTPDASEVPEAAWPADIRAAYERVHLSWTIETAPQIGYRHRTCTLVDRRPYYSRYQKRNSLVLTWEHECPRCHDRFRFTTGIQNAALFGLCVGCFWEEAKAGALGPHWANVAAGNALVEHEALASLPGPRSFRVFGGIERLTWRGNPVTQEDLRNAYVLRRPRGQPLEARRLTASDTRGWLNPLRGVVEVRPKPAPPPRSSPRPASPSNGPTGSLAADVAALQQQIAALTAALARLTPAAPQDTIRPATRTEGDAP